MKPENWLLLFLFIGLISWLGRVSVLGYRNRSSHYKSGDTPTSAFSDDPLHPAISSEEQRSLNLPLPSIKAKAGTIERNLIYRTVDGVNLMMDVYYPRRMNGSIPVIVYLHGGGWSSGDKAEAEKLWNLLKYYPVPYVLVSVNYRLAPLYQFPVQIEDVKNAVRFLRANAEIFHIDPDRIGVMGASAGGHLAALLGLCGKNTGWDVGENLNLSSEVRAVVVAAGPADFTRDFPAVNQSMAQSVFGIYDRDDPMVLLASPVSYISPGAPPFLILQGEKDNLVPLEQAQILYERLRSSNIVAELVIIKNAGHSLQSLDGPMKPNLLQLAMKIGDFYRKNL